MDGWTIHRGDHVQCLDDSDGAHFLRRGRIYLVVSIQLDDHSGRRLNLQGMNRAWEEERFLLIGPDEEKSN